jgi:hypothetical protein
LAVETVAVFPCSDENQSNEYKRPNKRAKNTITGIKGDSSRILKNTSNSPKKAGKGGTGITRRKVTRRKVTRRGLIVLTPRNKIISRVLKMKLICPTPKKRRGEEIPWKTISKIREKEAIQVGDRISRKISVICLTEEYATSRLKSD